MIARNLTKMKKAILCFYIKKIRNELVFLRNRLEGLCPAPRQTTCTSPGRLLRGPGSGFAAPRTLREQLAENKRQCPACPSTGVGGVAGRLASDTGLAFWKLHQQAGQGRHHSR